MRYPILPSLRIRAVQLPGRGSGPGSVPKRTRDGTGVPIIPPFVQNEGECQKNIKKTLIFDASCDEMGIILCTGSAESPPQQARAPVLRLTRKAESIESKGAAKKIQKKFIFDANVDAEASIIQSETENKVRSRGDPQKVPRGRPNLLETILSRIRLLQTILSRERIHTAAAVCGEGG